MTWLANPQGFGDGRHFLGAFAGGSYMVFFSASKESKDTEGEDRDTETVLIKRGIKDTSKPVVVRQR